MLIIHRFKDDYEFEDCCGTCPNICKDFAKEEKTYKNGTLDCGSFDDKSCYFECPQRCRDAYNRGETR